MDILSRMLANAMTEGIFQGIKLSRMCPSVFHLFFVDDSLIFLKATPGACEGIKNILSKFSQVSGEVINYSKSHILFSPNTPPRFKRFMRSIIDTPSADTSGKYLECNIEVDGRSATKYHHLV